MKIGFIYRYNISSVVFPSIQESIGEKTDLNLISGKRIREEFLSKDTELANTINGFIDNGKLIPKELWVPFFTSVWDAKKHNVFCGLVTQLDQFKLFENYFEENNLKIDFIKYYQIKDIDKAKRIAEEKYAKLFKNNTELLVKKITEYNIQIKEICQYSRDKCNVEYLDYFDDPIEITDANKA